ncbi:MAG: uncharacterized protein JWO77_3727 [Ilumatobacteraceae bacterium]|nr:uncharacterized protein [Ilumatobacteraceae bacterium]
MTTNAASPLTPYRPEPFLLRPGQPGPVLGVLAKNPSEPDSERNRTFASIAAYAAGNGFGEVLVVNLFSLRAKNPDRLGRVDYAKAVGPGNDEAITTWAQSCDRLVCAWGGARPIPASRYKRRISEVRSLLGGRALWSVGDPTTDGYPRHPCRNGWPITAELRPYAGAIWTWE